MKITTKISFREYLSFMFRLTYGKNSVIFLTVIAMLMLIAPILHYTHVLHMDQSPLYNLVFGLSVPIALPLGCYLQAKKIFKSHKRLQETIRYEFTPEQLVITGESFTSLLDWKNTYKVGELNQWFLIYDSAQVAILIPKADLDAAQVVEIRGLLKGIPGVKNELKKG
jgi:carbon starvation protein CstA